MPDTVVSLEFLASQVGHLIEETRHLRHEVADIRTLTLKTSEFTRRVERRQAELRDDLEMSIKMEIGGTSAALQTSIEGSLSRIEAKGLSAGSKRRLATSPIASKCWKAEDKDIRAAAHLLPQPALLTRKPHLAISAAMNGDSALFSAICICGIIID
ncbi:hypothetical protein [Afifella marina]|uniref:Uncharacterized protein n=1 Tax=Afifella marina DSM 2698 TaxID=1120955 RepID=A0A1G5MME7_AFIMA|nr:hypothetical protein [Afifella marina]MBK1623892.1 hypothetical protein [Afifella marina DSM 2698]MBK1627192.1 hypothetical protein [Afifella marina]MBK5918779.1 hypothetical protein [Afifella marina]RAI22612.1 hypothetical protein CH311_02785 [Afifella marina DSM 2698]SCZ25831.1 hypothetical protein SAMN03080610_00862 [Afifella marina DSM 2698]